MAEEYQKAHMRSKKLEKVDARKRDGHGRKNSERRKENGGIGSIRSLRLNEP